MSGPRDCAAMIGLMQDWPLTIDKFLEHAKRAHGHRLVVSKRDDGRSDQVSYSEVYANAQRVSGALRAHGIVQGDIVATLAMNSVEHLEAWYGICGIGAVCHTLNPRLFREHLIYIINHAADRMIFADGNFSLVLADILPSCPTVERVIFFSPTVGGELPVPVVHFNDFLASSTGAVIWGGFDERAAAGLCYTSGTTGKPKGVLYSHRSNYLHTLMALQPDVLGFSVRDCVLPAVPLYHANAWGVAFCAPAVGSKLVMPGAKLDGRSLYELIEEEKVTVSLGVPSVWLPFLDYVRTEGLRFSTLKRIFVGGAASSDRIIRDFAKLDIEAVSSWGMTELSPIGVVSSPTPEISALPFDEQLEWRLKQGRPPCEVDLKVIGSDGSPLPHDGVAAGRLLVRGPGVACGYFRDDKSRLEPDGFFDTGDIAIIDGLGFMKITDRAKDVIKSGGEWISSLDIENAALRHPAIAAAGAIGIGHAHWGERPLLYVQLKPDIVVTPAEIRAFLVDHLAKWCLPDQVVLVSELPLGPTGKVDKKKLREMNYQDRHPEA